jgi:hypothetical protein
MSAYASRARAGLAAAAAAAAVTALVLLAVYTSVPPHVMALMELCRTGCLRAAVYEAEKMALYCCKRCMTKHT